MRRLWTAFMSASATAPPSVGMETASSVREEERVLARDRRERSGRKRGGVTVVVGAATEPNGRAMGPPLPPTTATTRHRTVEIARGSEADSDIGIGSLFSSLSLTHTIKNVRLFPFPFPFSFRTRKSKYDYSHYHFLYAHWKLSTIIPIRVSFIVFLALFFSNN